MNQEQIMLTADIIIESNDGSIVLIKRGNDPYKNHWALPGGFMDDGETIEQAAVREAKEETGLDVVLTKLIGIYSKPGRDPRGRTVSALYVSRAIGGTLKADSDAKEIIQTKDFFNVDLAFDHNEMIQDYLKQKEKKI